ncbi:MAG: hypothetical protein KJ967_02715 [Elusimicrobia bacterium]|nr:hypothetical protein [Elusimicrobiota bacterium]
MSKIILTNDDKKRIREEEKYRAEVRLGLEENPEEKPSEEKQKKKGKGCLLVIILFVGLAFLFSFSSSPSKEKNIEPSPSPSPNTRENFKASVSFTGTQFIVTNLDNLDCQNAKMEINGELFKGGFTYEGYILEAGETYKIGALQFAKSDGTRFNPFQLKPNNFFIICRGNNVLDGAAGSWEFN